MQNRYAGDVGDFCKLGLLRAICGHTANDNKGKMSIGIVWYLVKDESHNLDGKHIQYSHKPKQYKSCDSSAYESLGAIAQSSNRSVKKIESSKLFGEDAIYYSRLLEPELSKGSKYRKEWRERAIEEIRGREIAFLDPDNGIECPSLSSSKAHKYVLWEDLKLFLKKFPILVVYHHLGRHKKSKNQITDLNKMSQKELDKKPKHIIVSRRGSRRAFLIFCDKKYDPLIKRRIKAFMESDWFRNGHFIKLQEM